MVERRIDDHAEAARVRRIDHRLEVVLVAVARIDAVEIGRDVAHAAGRRKDRHEEQRVDAEVGEIVELRGHALEVAGAVAVPPRVPEGAHEHLVDDMRRLLRQRLRGRVCAGGAFGRVVGGRAREEACCQDWEKTPQHQLRH